MEPMATLAYLEENLVSSWTETVAATTSSAQAIPAVGAAYVHVDLVDSTGISNRE